MFTSLHHLLSSGLGADRSPESPSLRGRSVLTRLITAAEGLPEEKQFELLKRLLAGRIEKVLLQQIIEMPEAQREQLLKQIEALKGAIAVHPRERRKYRRKDCLINAMLSSRGITSSSYILDLTPRGAYIETAESFPPGQAIVISFFSPLTGEPVTCIGIVVRDDSHGIGVRFNELGGRQLKAIKRFSEGHRKIYEITS
jgi:hypothetical protein